MRRRKTGTAQQARDARGNFTPPSQAAPSSGAPETPAAPQGEGGRFSPRNWRVATRLNAILLIPVLVALVFGGLDVKKSVDTWMEAEDAADTARVVRSAADYAQAVLEERDASVIPLLSGDQGDENVKKAREATDTARADFAEAVKSMPDTESLQRRLKAVRDAEPKLDRIRKNAFKTEAARTEDAYGSIQRPLMAFANELGLGTGTVTSYGRMVYAVSLAKAAESLQRSMGTHLLAKPQMAQKDRQFLLTSFASYNFLEYIAADEYRSGGSKADARRLSDTLAGKAQVDQQNKAALAIMSGASDEKLKALGVTDKSWYALSTGKFEAYREVEKHLTDRAVDEASKVSADARRTALVNSAIMVVALLAAFFVAGRIARSMSRSMRRLRGAAFEVAEQRLPALVDQLSRTEPGRIDTRVQPIPITTKDEIGEVARAFDQVHREAVRLAAEQALLRGNVNAIFTNLSRRNQSLIEGQLELITGLENNEADPDQLENLFRLDHLATRMRRNGENLLILAGEEPGRRWDQPIPLVDVLRAASSEVEAYERIQLDGVPEAEIHGLAVTDLVHLLAELLENATTFSSPHTKVRVTATRLPDGRVMIEIHDKGIGLTPEDFADINHRLANPPTVDAAVSQRMGLFVVGRLAMRHGIRVQLRPSGEQAGTTSLVMLPERITHGGGGEDEPAGDDFTVSRIVPEQSAAPAVPGMRTAAELGFDDSRYEAPQAAGEHTPDPLGRSRLREERRAALEEAQAQAAAQSAPGDPLFPEAAPQQPYGQQQSHEQALPHDTRQTPFPQQAPADQAYGDQPYTEGGYAGGGFTDQQTYGDYNAPAAQGDWSESGTYQHGYTAGYGAESESQPTADTAQPERVEFDRPGPATSGPPSLTGSGLPRRDKRWQQPDTGEEATRDGGADQSQQGIAQQSRSGEARPGEDAAAAQSANDERWHRAEQLREPKAGGTTSSGLPRRVPRANLVEGKAADTAEQRPGQTQISRAPEDVRGRLSNLRRGVQQGRSAGTDSSEFPAITAHEQHQQHDQGFGPGGTYEQER
ncbi:nitrate- and nitrite sensing domain-containing protein [Streptomyces sp. AV19]|uniref:sensor histidine kinase n=1 Tax=Streptomyces sp. AV19 TaxID=2793068 RepID=UPI0018FE90E2|nr:nitrate- and nitrite sensing domain-containing protein [Streptomyces sp. AV19]MBH1933939.1 nitrate- and nitrite sensing domain-containing protein [Streptomyces sp. AV19]MDG4535578.1 nitrate- and nitrite sensing domain-containing protein [Streptomyces sp. AV19]